MIISFSGIDGSGKTTLLNHLKKELVEKGYKVKIFAMYDDITLYSKIRKLRDVFFKKKNQDIKQTYSSHLIGVDDKKKIYKKIIYYLFRSLFFKKFFLIIDIFLFFFFIKFNNIFKKKDKVYLFDRYLFDSIIDTLNYPKTNFFFAKCISNILPRIDFSFLIITDPKIAYLRKKEFVEEYNKWRQESYIKIFKFTHLENNIILNENLDESKNNIIKKVLKYDPNK